ncbi:hypothetical protein ABFV05_003228 [Capra hircus]
MEALILILRDILANLATGSLLSFLRVLHSSFQRGQFSQQSLLEKEVILAATWNFQPKGIQLPKGGKNQELLLKEVALAGAPGKNRGGRCARLGPDSSPASRARAAAAIRRDPRELPAGVAQEN